MESAEQWTIILDALGGYYRRNEGNAEVAAYAHQIYQLALHSHMQRQEAGGWAGEFTRTLLLIAANDTAARGQHWDNPPHEWWRPACALVLGSLCGTVQAGNEHFSQHLAPGFYEYIKTRLVRVGRTGDPSGAFERIRVDMRAIIAEHDKLIELAVRPAAQQVHEYGSPFFRSLIAFNIAGDAVKLRRDTLDRIRLELAAEGIISRSDGLRLLAVFSPFGIGMR
jgi:hypothetical protein